MTYKQKGFPMHSSKSALKQVSPLKDPYHGGAPDHVHGPGYLPEEGAQQRREYIKQLLAKGMVARSPEFDKLVAEWTQNYKKNNPHPTMPTNVDIRDMKKRGVISKELGSEGVEVAKV